MCVEGRSGLGKREAGSLEVTGGRGAVLRKQQDMQGWSSGREWWEGPSPLPQPQTADCEGMKIAPYGGAVL